MALPVLGALVGPLMSIADTVLNRVIPDPAQREKAKAEMAREIMNQESGILRAASSVIRSEAQGTWLQRSWRPITMLCFVAIVANNYILVPYLSLFGLPNVYLDPPEPLWDLLKIGLGGYVIGRSAEKVAKNWRDGG